MQSKVLRNRFEETNRIVWYTPTHVVTGSLFHMMLSEGVPKSYEYLIKLESRKPLLLIL